ncbi:carboxymuconolactone decarboxylase family protein [Mesorhizobium sp. ES1-6]|uniref:carboxymuconolactone decarboxylase family protein n=1 Tax=Mesorhizobium sp. ES1-6 TaxID=2876626 RepID=UPI001CCDE500|nr:carboxymuconolactone decarboxylase family protein [Mesorhizobium sp. ES1-6]MBZ9803445.1 carboxymuconolactone decarboxylase family protein [Mesorhizobium sp. ES1-6]
MGEHQHARQAERTLRATETPIVDGLPDFPGILTAMMISADLATPLRLLADALLVKPFPGSTLTRPERELIATAVSAGNDCFYCMDTHAAFADALLQREGVGADRSRGLVDEVKDGRLTGLAERTRQLIRIALIVRSSGRKLAGRHIAAARSSGASNADVQLTILIASAFCMYNRIVDGFRARTPSDPTAFGERAQQIASYGYADPRITAVPTAASCVPAMSYLSLA